jgi:hypothetical protein
MLTTFTVTNLGDATVTGPGSAPGTLRQAVYDANVANDPDTIEFASGLSGDLRLSIADDSAVGLSALVITSPITIRGNSAGITIKRDVTAPSMRLFRVALGGDLTINSLNLTTGLTVGSNGAPGQSGGTAYAGAIYNQGDLQILNSSLYNNSTLGGNAGAGGNSGAAHGGAIFSDGGNVTITNSTLSGNSALNGSGPLVARSFGGGLYVKNGTLNVYNSTITNGTAASGREVYVIGLGAGQTATAHFYSSILAQADVSANLDVNTTEDLDGHVVVSGANNLVRSHTLPPSMVIVSDNPLLAPLSNNGGPTLTHALPSESPAVGQGSNPLNLASDQRATGFARNVGGQADIGAYEVQSTLSQNQPGDYNGNGSVDAGDYVLWRKTLGTPVTQFSGADGNGSSAIDAGDYDVWRGHFGAPAAAGTVFDLLRVSSAAQDADNAQAESTIDGALLASLAPAVARQVRSVDPSNANLSRASRAQSAISLDERDEALLAITSSPAAKELRPSPARRRAHPGGKDTAQPRELTAGLTQSLLQTLPCGAASTSKA